MILDQPVRDPHADITIQEAKVALSNNGIFSDDPALALVVQDTERAESEENRRSWITGWNSARDLYNSLYCPQYWPGTQIEAASVNFFTVATAINGINPQVLAGLFYENPPFIVQERSGTSAQLARAVSDLLGYQLEDIGFDEEIRLGGMNFLLFGTAIWQYGWEKFTTERTILKRKTPRVVVKATVPGAKDTYLSDDELEEEIIEEVTDRPTFEHIINLREVLVDPGLAVPDIRKAKYVVRRRYMTWDDLDKLRGREGYNIPSKEELLKLFFPPREPVESNVSEDGGRNPLWDARAEPRWDDTTADPFQKPLEVLERWDNKTYIVVLQKKAVIYNGQNVYRKIPFLSVGWWDTPGAFWSIGLGRTIGTEQRLQTGTTNLMLNMANLKLNAPFVRVRGKSIPTQSVRIGPNRMIEVDQKGDLEVLHFDGPVQEVGQILGGSQSRVDTVSGNSPMSGSGIAGASGHSNLARTATGAQGLLQGASNAISECVDKLSRQVIVPLLYAMQEMNRAMLPPSQLRFIMSDELQHEYLENGGDEVDILNAKVKFKVLAGAKMQTRRLMTQALPLISQFLGNPQLIEQLALEGKKVAIDELIRLWLEMAELKDVADLIVPMTQEDFQRRQQASQGGVQQQKFQQQQQLLQQKAAQQEAQADASNVALSAREVLRAAFKKAVEPEEFTGEPNTSGSGLGSVI